MHNLFPYIAKDVLFYGITTISTTIISIQNIFEFIVNHKDSEYKIYILELQKTDLHNKLNVISAIIKNMIEKYSVETNNLIQTENIINKILYCCESEEYNIINLDTNNITLKLEDPIKIALLSTLDIIIKIHKIFDKIHTKILNREKVYFKFFYNLNIHDEINDIIFYDNILDKRMYLLFETLKIY